MEHQKKLLDETKDRNLDIYASYSEALIGIDLSQGNDFTAFLFPLDDGRERRSSMLGCWDNEEDAQ